MPFFVHNRHAPKIAVQHVRTYPVCVESFVSYKGIAVADAKYLCFQIAVGKNPRGIVINSTDTRAYVWNYVSRDISVIDLTQSPETVAATEKES